MRGALGWILAIAAGVVLVIVVTAMIGTRDDRNETVTAGKWAQSTCGVVGAWRGEVESIVDDVRTPPAVGTTGTEEPQSETQQGRTGFVRQGLERAVQATETLVTGIDNVGVPDTPQGEDAATQISDWADSSLDDLEAAQDSLDEEADTLEEAITQVTTAAGAIGSVLTSGVRTLTAVASSDAELAAALQSSSTCQELRRKEAAS